MQQIQKVVFRKWPKSKGGEVIALFCNTASDCCPGMVMSYMHIGQHGEASRHLGASLKLATPEEYAPLLTELQSVYSPEYKIATVKRLIA